MHIHKSLRRLKEDSSGFSHYLLPIVIIVLVGAIGTFLVVSGRAAASGYSICSNKGGGYCLQETGNSVGDYIETKSYSASSGAQKFTSAYFNGCSGSHKVTSKCPFALGSGLNTKFKGDSIETIHFSRESGNTCLGANGSDEVIVRKCPGDGSATGTEWVLGSSYQFINVYESDLAPVSAAYMCSQSKINALVILSGYAAVRCQWGTR